MALSDIMAISSAKRRWFSLFCQLICMKILSNTTINCLYKSDLFLREVVWRMFHSGIYILVSIVYSVCCLLYFVWPSVQHSTVSKASWKSISYWRGNSISWSSGKMITGPLQSIDLWLYASFFTDSYKRQRQSSAFLQHHSCHQSRRHQRQRSGIWTDLLWC